MWILTCLPSKKLLEIGNGIDRDEIKKLTDEPVWTDGFRNNETKGEFVWRFSTNSNLSSNVDFTVTPMDNSTVCEDECCRLVFNPLSGTVFPVSCNVSEKFSTVCQFYNRMEVDHKIDVVQEKVQTEQSDLRWMIFVNGLRVDAVRSNSKELFNFIVRVRDDSKMSLNPINDSIDSLRQQMKGSKNTLTALVITSLVVNVILGVLFYMLFKKVNSRS